MARLRKFVCYRNHERPYTRTSKYKDKAYIRANPNIKIAKWETGNTKKKFGHVVNLVAKRDVQIRDNALESARMTSNRLLEKKVGTSSYHLKVAVYPFHILRENPIAAGAGADRFSTGMKKSFGKPIGVAAQVKKGQAVFRVGVDKKDLDTARLAMNRASKKLPTPCIVEVVQNS